MNSRSPKRFHAGVEIPLEFVDVAAPDFRRPTCWRTVFSRVEQQSPAWCCFDCIFPRIAQTAARRFDSQQFAHRYDLIRADALLFIRLKPGLKSVYEELEWTVTSSSD